ncbi:MAG: tetratricopeptide repeat protein [Verrucomicrobiia bacterium]
MQTDPVQSGSVRGRMMDGSLVVLMAFLLNYQEWLSSPLAWLAVAFQLWMLVDAIRRQEWLWVVFIVIFPLLNAVLYFILVYRAGPALVSARFELPGAVDRRRIKELQAQIHHLDKAHHHSQLGDIYFQQGKFADAEKCYRNALERDPEDADTRAHLGQTLLRLGRAQEGLPLLEEVCLKNPKHDYGYTLMALAETYSALGQKDKAVQTWQNVAENYSYARARVELAGLHLEAGRSELAKARLQEAVADDVHAPAFERRHERFWIRRAKKMLRRLQ